jgi:glycosyltransferase involved in cell wall biosynthesis
MISVVIPVFNTARYLERVIAALRAQEYAREDYELIFVDNGSGDNSREVLERHSDLRVLREPERGSYAARNRGVREARGDIVAFTDSDCFPVAGWLRSIEAGFRDERRHILMGPRIPPGNDSWVRLVSEYENKKAELVCAGEDPLVYFGYTNNMAVRRTTLDRFGPFIQRERGSDTIFVRGVVEGLGCDAVAYLPDMAVRHAELESIGVYYDKVRTYGRSRKAYRHITTVRPLSAMERLRVFREATRRHPMRDSMQLFALLLGGQFAWWWGGLGVKRSDR